MVWTVWYTATGEVTVVGRMLKAKYGSAIGRAAVVAE